MALALDKVLHQAGIDRYLNLVSFGNGACGVQDAARTYFGIDAAQLNWQQAALLAGVVQSASALNPYANPGALDRHNLVLDTMIENVADQADALQTAREQPLGILPPTQLALPQNCIAAGDRGFFCDYALGTPRRDP